MSERASRLFDAVVIGTGFGGAVAACRLAQAGKTICILERGRRYQKNDFPRPATRPDHLPQTARWAWPLDQGLWDVKDLQGTLSVQGAGYGGGSLVYANVHLRPPKEVFSPQNGWPKDYTRAELDPYYDTVAAALRVQPLPAHPVPPVPKADAMRDAATALGRTQWFFRPPLAIDFKACVMCGECIAGCQIHAKNTLDLNYLAAAERTADEADRLDVRTLAEVLEITEDRVDSALTYAVHYRDHVTRADDTVRGKSVFLCAGAVNSTYILLRSPRLSIEPKSRANIGRRFFANGDAIAMVYDTRPAPTPAVGPTITSTLLYNHNKDSGGKSPAEWFMLQDGGYPKWLEPLMGLFRGEFWLGRNRLERTKAGHADDEEVAALMEPAKAMARALIDLLDVRRSLQTSLRMDNGRTVAALGFDTVVPPQIRDQLLPRLRKFIHDLERREADVVSHKTLDEVGRRVKEEHGFYGMFVNKAKRVAEPYLVPSAVEILHRHYLKAPPGTPEPLTAAIIWPLLVEAAQKLFVGKRPDDHALLMLAVGVDPAPGRLFLDDANRLVAYWDAAANMPLTTIEERLMHDVADALGGEMRLSPDSTARQRPVTVHNLGGCTMADRPEDGVTDANGKVWGSHALYVLDGAAIPSSLGANPSATIAAVGERNVRKALGDPKSPIYTATPVPLDPPLPGGRPLAEIRRELGHTQAVLDPIAGIPPTTQPPRTPALGMKFDEVMQGFYELNPPPDPPTNRPIRAEFLATIEDLNAFLVNPQRPVTISGTVWLTPALGRAQVAYAASGDLFLLKRAEAVTALSTLLERGLALVRRTDSEPAEIDGLLREIQSQAHRYEMRYTLTLEGPGGPYKFHGKKTIHGGPGASAWTQTTTLALALSREGEPEPFGCGTMHVHLADFLGRQLPSFTVIGTHDDVRIAWAFGRFFRFFFGTLRQVYLPHGEVLDPFRDSKYSEP